MNLQTVANYVPKIAQNSEALIVFSSRKMAENCDKSAIVCENSPRSTALSSDFGKPTNAEIIADLNRAKCAFQLATVCAVIGLPTPPSGETT